MKYTLIIVFSFIFLCCTNQNKDDVKEQNIFSQDSDIMPNTDTWTVVMDTTIDGVEYSIKTPNDTINNTVFFFYGHDKYYQLDAEKLGFHKYIDDYSEFRYPQVVIYRPSTAKFEQQKLVIKPNYYLLTLSNSGYMFMNVCILFKDSVEIKKCHIFPKHESDLIDFSDDGGDWMWAFFFDIEKEILVTEERLGSYNTGTYLVTVYKIEEDTIIRVAENVNNHENYNYFKKKDHPFERMMMDNIRKTMKKK